MKPAEVVPGVNKLCSHGVRESAWLFFQSRAMYLSKVRCLPRPAPTDVDVYLKISKEGDCIASSVVLTASYQDLQLSHRSLFGCFLSFSKGFGEQSITLQKLLHIERRLPCFLASCLYCPSLNKSTSFHLSLQVIFAKPLIVLVALL